MPIRWKRGFKVIGFNTETASCFEEYEKMPLQEQAANSSAGCFTSARKRKEVPFHCTKYSFQRVSELAWIGEWYRCSKEKSNEKNHRRTCAEDIASSKIHFKRPFQCWVHVKKDRRSWLFCMSNQIYFHSNYLVLSKYNPKRFFLLLTYYSYKEIVVFECIKMFFLIVMELIRFTIIHWNYSIPWWMPITHTEEWFNTTWGSAVLWA